MPLPGRRQGWPQDVRIDGVAAVDLRPRAGPARARGRSASTVSGDFGWDSQPESLQLPGETGLLALTLRGQAVDIP